MSDARQVQPDRVEAGARQSEPAYDPLRLCATVALLAWLGGPLALLGFALLGVVGYARARHHGLLRSKCLLGDTRLVLAYLTGLAVLAAVAITKGWW
jgi:hypothetical protein